MWQVVSAGFMRLACNSGGAPKERRQQAKTIAVDVDDRKEVGRGQRGCGVSVT
jgi:hypothetical protein